MHKGYDIQQRIPTLDGWRGIAVLLVIASHAGIALRATFHLQTPEYLGQHGVTLFFVLSGFLITSRLVQEERTTGSIHLAAFYIRRFFRIMPCAWAYLVIMIVGTVGKTPRPYTMGELLGSLFFFRNFLDPAGQHAITGHFWSLSIEEQFYLLWPGVLLLAGTARARWIAVAGASAIALYRLAHWSALSTVVLPATFGTQYRADALLIGCAAALLLPDARPYLRSWMVTPVAAYLLWSIGNYGQLIPFSESIAIALLLVLTTEAPHRWPGRALEWKPLATLGGFSYSLYLWQQVFVLGIRTVSGFCLGLLSLAVVVLASHRYLEKPMIRKGKHLADRLTARQDGLGSTIHPGTVPAVD